MKAIILHHFGPAEALEMAEVKIPTPGDKQVLIKIKAAGINPADTKARAGTSGIAKRLKMPVILGWDMSGIVERCGGQVTSLKPGDAVFGCIGFPGLGKAYAEYAVADEDQLAEKPQHVSFEQAAALPIAGLTAYQSIHDHLKLQAGQSILIQAAAGGVGHLTIQLAKLIHVHVIGTASSKNKAFLESIGIDQFIDYTREKFEDVVQNVDAVQDAMGGEVLYRSIGCLKRGGRAVCLPSSTKDDPKAISLALEKDVSLVWPMMYPSGQQLKILARLLEEKKLVIQLDHVFPFHEIVEAHKRIETHRTAGKIVIRID